MHFSTGTILATAFFYSSIAAALLTAYSVAAAEPPLEWIEPETGHRVVRISREPGSASLYFHQNAYSADGKKLLITTPGGLSAVDVETRDVQRIVEGRVRVLVTGRKTGDIYYIRDDAVFATDLHTGKTREVAKIPPDLRRGVTITVNADETLLVGTATDLERDPEPKQPPPGNSGGRLERRWAAGIPMVLFTIDVATGDVRKIHRSTNWLNHLQCSPTDPTLIMFCHEGPWHYVDRIWTVRTDGKDLRLMHERTMDMEIAGHEFFSADGNIVWYDLQTPKSGVFWVAGVEMETGKRIQYFLERDEWSVHYNISPDGTLFAGDGGGPRSVANRTADGRSLNPPGNGQWIYLFRPVLVNNPARVFPNQRNLTQVGYFQSKRLVDLSNHDYDLEPNVTFTPDAKWIVFRSNMHGPVHVYAVEVTPAASTRSVAVDPRRE